MEHAARSASIELVFSSKLTQTCTKAMAPAHFAPVTILECKNLRRLIRSGTARNLELLDMTHLCAIIDAAHAPKKRGSYKKRRARGHDGLV
jgi:hypothetical protein